MHPGQDQSTISGQIDVPAKPIGIREIVVTIDAKRHNPSILNPDFLKINKIVPPDWELAESPICVEPHAEVRFTSGVSIIAEFEDISFSEVIKPEKDITVCIPLIAESYINLLPHVDYTGAGVEISGDIVMPEPEMEEFFDKKLLRSGPWRRLNGQQARVGLRLRYPIENGHLTLTIAPAARETTDGPVAVLYFGGVFQRQANAEDQRGRFKQVTEFIARFTEDIALYLGLVNGSFLSGE